ncbi:sulfhydryl oxidase 2 isoform X1 [Cervus elaphus]|uniref:sulfhydryl oxidase 2 isoform X1 n=1 Tax=Cervus canadensis TaxID=1574408 RepID=UPI001C9E6072|nr:sulfhydryl oxidase 2 isoform X1 [Cervus canadensis]XP_043772334.1 sulfhydryl oxidase 2 isoform X1 [Cervus elaphus]
MAAAGTVASAAPSPGAPAATAAAARTRRPPPARPARLPPVLVLLAAAAAAGPGAGGAARLYRAGEDAVWVLDSGSVRKATANSSAAWLVQFYSSWCGHCIGYAPTWRALAADVRDWAAAIRVAALDCAEEKNQEVCRAYDIHFYPTFRYFKAFTKDFTTGENFKGPDRELQTVRRTMINFLQNHTDGNRPPACPSLDPIRPSDVLSLIERRGDRYVAVLLEDDSSYVGREVILDLIPYENVEVKRALGSDTTFLQKLGVPSLPSCYLIYPNGSHGSVTVGKPLRSFFSSYLRSLPGVRKKPSSLPGRPSREESSEAVVWRDFDRSKLYTADLESGLHHLLRVELAAHRSLAGAELKTLKDFVTVLAKLFPGRPPVRKLLEMLQEWLASLPLDRIPYDAVLDLVNNKMRISGIFLTNHVKWVGCQGSRPELRGYSCSLWKLFHTLTVGAGTHPKALDGTGLEDDPQAVLQTIRRYVHVFFGCKECGEHFEEMAKESIDSVKTPDQAILWLWKKHNLVNSRLAGHPSEDPKFPKVPWPSPDLCPACHEEIKGLGTWNEGQVLLFLKQHYSRDNLVDTHSADLGGPGEGAPAPGEKQEGSRAPPEQPPADHGAESLRPPSLLPPRPRLSERSQPGLDLPLGSRAGGEGPRGAEAAAAFLGMGFSSLDMSLCVLLYVASSLFLMVMYFFFRVRSKRWKVKHHHPSV